MTTEEKLSFFYELINCNYALFRWEYDQNFQMLFTDWTNLLFSSGFLVYTGLEKVIRRHLETGSRLPVILEIDPPVDDISIRRRHFYERLGFVANPYEYIHPSFRKPFTPHQLILMSYPGPLTYDEARGFADFVRETVLGYSEHEAPTLPKLP